MCGTTALQKCRHQIQEGSGKCGTHVSWCRFCPARLVIARQALHCTTLGHRKRARRTARCAFLSLAVGVDGGGSAGGAEDRVGGAVKRVVLNRVLYAVSRVPASAKKKEKTKGGKTETRIRFEKTEWQHTQKKMKAGAAHRRVELFLTRNTLITHNLILISQLARVQFSIFNKAWLGTTRT